MIACIRDVKLLLKEVNLKPYHIIIDKCAATRQDKKLRKMVLSGVHHEPEKLQRFKDLLVERGFKNVWWDNTYFRIIVSLNTQDTEA